MSLKITKFNIKTHESELLNIRTISYIDSNRTIYSFDNKNCVKILYDDGFEEKYYLDMSCGNFDFENSLVDIKIRGNLNIGLVKDKEYYHQERLKYLDYIPSYLIK